jgi:hypothetical protein
MHYIDLQWGDKLNREINNQLLISAFFIEIYFAESHNQCTKSTKIKNEYLPSGAEISVSKRTDCIEHIEIANILINGTVLDKNQIILYHCILETYLRAYTWFDQN